MNDVKPIRLQRKRTKGFKLKANNGLPIVYVGRGSLWGNPFRVVMYSDGKWAVKSDGSEKCNEILINNCKSFYDTRDEAATDAIKCYNYWLLPYRHGDSLMEFYKTMAEFESVITNLKGKNLSCWCSLDEKCHADFLLELANVKEKKD
jgi:hypothetical protein